MTNSNNILNKKRKSDLIYKILIIFPIVMVLASCDVLDKQPLDRYSDAAIWQDQTLIEQFVNHTYRITPDGFNLGFSFPALACLGCVTDEADGISEFYDEVNAGNIIPSNLNVLDYWEDYYAVIAKTNIFLDEIDGASIDDEVKTRMTGEMKFLRAYSYFRLISFYGGVPIIRKPLTLADDLERPRDRYEDVMEFVITDLDEAAPLLPLEYDVANKGRITKGAALALKSRALLYAASPLNNPGNDMNDWQMAADAAKEVIDLDIYEIYPDYKELFLEEGVYNSEIIWSRPYNSLVDFEGPAVEIFLYPPGSGGRASINPLHNLVDDYETLNGMQPEDDESYDSQDPYVNRDPRFYATILYDGAPFKGREIEVFVPGGVDSERPTEGANPVPRPGYYLRKYMDESITDPTEQNIGSTPWTFIRYAEVLLNYAEATYHLGDEATSRMYLNMVRSRPSVDMPEVTDSGSALLERIQNERRIELAFEEHRWFDVRRWKIAPGVLNENAKKISITKDPDTGEKTYEVQDFPPERAFFEKNYLLPIPQYEMDKNPLFEQNPGY